MQPPVGFWDPLGFTKTDDAASFRRRRYVELKHGRVAMFAAPAKQGSGRSGPENLEVSWTSFL